VAKLLGAMNSEGFTTFGAGAGPYNSAGVLVDTFRRFSILREVETHRLKDASHCGGLPSRAHLGIPADATCPGMENLSNDEYRRVGKHLLGMLNDDQKAKVGFDNVAFFELLGDGKWGIFIRACLAASHMAYNAERGRSNIYSELQGGTHGVGDSVAAYLVNTLTTRPFPWAVSSWR